MLSNVWTRRCCFLLVLASMLGIMASLPQATYACSCIEPPAPDVALEESAAVFAGKVITVDGPERRAVFVSTFPFIAFAGGMGSTEATFQVSKVWKGPPHQQILVGTTGDSAMCGYSFEGGQEYVVYANNTPEGLSTTLCSRTQPLDHAQEDLAVLGAGSPPTIEGAATPASTPLSPIAFVSLIAVLVAIVALALARRRRSMTGT